MSITAAQRQADGSILVTMDSTDMLVPDDMANVDRQALAAWVEEGGVVQPYQPPITPPVERLFSWLEFMDLFTEPEEVQIVGASMSDVDVKRWYDRAQGSGGIKLSDPRVAAGIQTLVDANLITPERRDEIMAGEMQRGT